MQVTASMTWCSSAEKRLLPFSGATVAAASVVAAVVVVVSMHGVSMSGRSFPS